MRRRKIDTENLGENTPISLRLPKKILDWIQEACEENPDVYTGRNHFIETACRYYLNSAPCSNCGNLNHREAMLCSYCGERFVQFSLMLEEFHNLLDLYEEELVAGLQLFSEYQNIVEELEHCLSSFSNTILKDHLMSEFERHQVLCNDIAGSSLVFYDTYNQLSPDFIYSDLYKEQLSNVYTLEADLHTFKLYNFPGKVSLSQLDVIRHLAYYHACKKILSDDPMKYQTPDYLNLKEPLLDSLIQEVKLHKNRLKLACDDLRLFNRMVFLFKETRD